MWDGDAIAPCTRFDCRYIGLVCIACMSALSVERRMSVHPLAPPAGTAGTMHTTGHARTHACTARPRPSLPASSIPGPGASGLQVCAGPSQPFLLDMWKFSLSEYFSGDIQEPIYNYLEDNILQIFPRFMENITPSVQKHLYIMRSVPTHPLMTAFN